MKLTKLTEAEFNARNEESCTESGRKPTVRVYDGDILVKIRGEIDDLIIPPGTYKSLVFIPCELVGEFNWVRAFSAEYITGVKGTTISPYGPRKPRTYKPGDYTIVNLENNGVLFAFAHA